MKLERAFFSTVAVVVVAMTTLLMRLPTPENDVQITEHANRLLIKNARLFDGENMQQSANLLIENGLISSIEKTSDTSNIRVIDATGKIILPGLIDSHTHNFGESLNNAINFGVTTHIDMFTSTEFFNNERRTSRASVAQKQHTDLFSAGMLATAAGGHGTQFGQPVETIDHPQQAQAWVAKRIAEGSDFIKLVYMPNNQHFASLDLATASALIKAAHKTDLLAVAHIST